MASVCHTHVYQKPVVACPTVSDTRHCIKTSDTGIHTLAYSRLKHTILSLNLNPNYTHLQVRSPH